MTVYVTGDTHGGFDAEKLRASQFGRGGYLSKDDVVIIAGDFGYIWTGHSNLRERRQLRCIANKPWTTLFIDGNHENHPRLLRLPEEQGYGGSVGVVANSVYHLRRGGVYQVGGMKVFAMGGAHSSARDKATRVEGKGWWPGEVPTAEQRAYAEQSLAACGWCVDIVVTHDAPSGMPKGIGRFRSTHPEDEYTDWLRGIADRLAFSHWYFGHHHVDESFFDGRFRCLYHDVVEARSGEIITPEPFIKPVKHLLPLRAKPATSAVQQMHKHRHLAFLA